MEKVKYRVTFDAEFDGEANIDYREDLIRILDQIWAPENITIIKVTPDHKPAKSF